jgi:hypothetical protein
MALGNLGLASWLEQYQAGDFAWIIPGLMESALYAALGAAVLELLRDFVEHPLPVIGLSRAPAVEKQRPPRVPLGQRLLARLRANRKQQPSNAAKSTAAAESTAAQVSVAKDGSYEPVPVPPNLPRRDAKKQRPDDVIKIELD